MQHKKHILIVDDEIDIRNLLSVMLREFDVDSACNVDEALTFTEHQKYDLVISDIKMQGKTGFDLIDGLHDRSVDTPVLLMTGHIDSKQLVKEVTGVDIDCLTKPFRFAQLKTAMDTIFHRSIH